ncbi:MAG: alpha-ketoglutarate-dependent dioxygenase AlkB [Chloroflexota bacterium]
MSNQAQQLTMNNADVIFYPHFLTSNEASTLFTTLEHDVAWQQSEIEMFGKTIQLPRLTAWYGDEGNTYSYSGVSHTPLAWIPPLATLKIQVEAIAKVNFNSVLLNLYRDGKDSVGWHSDDEPELGTNPVIASISLGGEREFQFRHKDNPEERHSLVLTSGSLLLMQGATQHHWKHRIPKTKKEIAPRINMTFRIIYSDS